MGAAGPQVPPRWQCHAVALTLFCYSVCPPPSPSAPGASPVLQACHALVRCSLMCALAVLRDPKAQAQASLAETVALHAIQVAHLAATDPR